MAEITRSENVIKKLQEFDKYVSQALEVLESLRKIKQYAEELNHSISQKKDELARHEEELSAFLKKAHSVSEEADAILSPMLKEKEELDRLDRKLTDGLAGLDATLESKIEEGLALHNEFVKTEMDKLNRQQNELQQQADAFFKDLLKNFESELDKLSESQKAFQAKVSESIQAIRNELDSQIADFLYKQNALVSNLSQQIDSYQRLTESLKLNLEGQSNQISQLETQNAELRKVIDRQGQEFSTKLSDLLDGKIQQLEEDIVQMKTGLNEVTAKLNNMKFKKLLGL